MAQKDMSQIILCGAILVIVVKVMTIAMMGNKVVRKQKKIAIKNSVIVF